MGDNMEFFIDTADVNEIKKYAHLVQGVTTNPSLIAKSGRKFEEVVKEICKIVDGPISAEAVSTKADLIIKESIELAKIHENIVIKVALDEEGLKAVKELNAKGINTNVTLCFSAMQALLAAKAGATYISPFVGRLDDIGNEGMELIDEIKEIYENYMFDTKILVASIRSPLHVKQSAMIGADVATIPPKVLGQLFKHPLTDSGIKKFLEDWEKVPK